MNTFAALQNDLEAHLKPFVGEIQDGFLERKAQRSVNEFFKIRNARNKLTVIGSSGIEIVGCDLAFDIGKIKVRRWHTRFYPTDVYDVALTVQKHVALGYVNDYQVYIDLCSEVAMLVARRGMGHAFATWTPSSNVIIPSQSIFHLVFERCRELGYSDLWIKS